MVGYTQLVNNREMVGIVQRTFNHVDPRLVDHGKRVAYFVSRMLRADGTFSPLEQRDICMLALMHDIGAYKTEEIDQMVQFETGSVWDHSIYGYLFLKYFSSYQEQAPVILLHHADWERLRGTDRVSARCKRVAQMFYLCDRADMFLESAQRTLADFCAYARSMEGVRFSPEAVALFLRAQELYPFGPREGWDGALDEVLEAVPFTSVEVDACLRMLIFAIDFRSQHTVAHTVTTTIISWELAKLLGFDRRQVDEVVCGALLHDLGKIGIPVEILEYPGKLSPQALTVMRTHVALTAEILGGGVSPAIERLALRHHEKLDGSGYPAGLGARDLTPGQRVVAVADIVSALSGTRSYKEAFPKEKTLGIVRQMSADGLIDSGIVALLCEHYDAIMREVRVRAEPLVDIYHKVTAEYASLRVLFE